METIAILEALLKWEDKLLGRRFLVVTDHKALEFFKTQKRLNSRQARWMEFLARFDFDITYVKGETNLVADALSRYFENDHWDDSYDESQYVNADARLDPEGEDLPWDRFEENRAMQTADVPRIEGHPQWQQRAPRRADEPVSYAPKRPIIEGVEARQHEAADLAANKESSRPPPPSTGRSSPKDQVDPTINESLGHLPDLRPQIEGDRSILINIRNGYKDNPLLAKVLNNIEHHHNFETDNGLLYTRNRAGNSVLCIPSVIRNKRRLTEIIIAQAHQVLGHFGPQKTAEYVRCHYRWPRIGQDVPHLPNNEIQHSKSARTSTQSADPHTPMGIHSDGLRRPIPRIERS
jgi:hypothetical protein